MKVKCFSEPSPEQLEKAFALWYEANKHITVQDIRFSTMRFGGDIYCSMLVIYQET